MQRPLQGSLSLLESDWVVQGLEFRLPMKGVWVGVEKTLDEEDARRATLSLKRSF